MKRRHMDHWSKRHSQKVGGSVGSNEGSASGSERRGNYRGVRLFLLNCFYLVMDELLNARWGSRKKHTATEKAFAPVFSPSFRTRASLVGRCFTVPTAAFMVHRFNQIVIRALNFGERPRSTDG